MREWAPNFRPERGTIDKVVVWVRLRELPIEYYDMDFLHFVGDRIRCTIKVDKNTMAIKRGKYARICVEIDLDKPLLPMFEIKKHIYRVEYQGLHLLYRTCGKFGQYKEGCSVKPQEVRVETNPNQHVGSTFGGQSKPDDSSNVHG